MTIIQSMCFVLLMCKTLDGIPLLTANTEPNSILLKTLSFVILCNFTLLFYFGNKLCL